MKQASLLEVWKSKLESQNSDSKRTFKNYYASLKEFCSFVQSSPEELVNEWHKARVTGNMLDRDNYVENTLNLIDQYLAVLKASEKYTVGSISNKLTAVASFYRYMRIPIEAKIPSRHVVYHNRDIKVEEIREIVNASTLRDKAFYIMMAQSGLRPVTLCQLRYKHIKEDFEANRAPALIRVPKELAKGKFKDYWTFLAQESLDALREYFKTRTSLTDEDYLFIVGKEHPRPLSEVAISAKFNLTVRRLKLLSKEQLEQRRNKPSELRLYSLRKFFRNNARGSEALTQFWMGHSLPLDDEHYLTQDVETHRQEYAKIQDNLTIQIRQPQTNAEVESLSKQLEEERNKRKELEASIQKITKDLELFKEFVRESEKYEYVRVPKKKTKKSKAD